jgi:DNA-binding NarL/FixJ family response regulator
MKILIADDHALIRSGLRGELDGLDPAVDFVEAWDAESTRTAFDLHPDLELALVDLTMPGMSGARSIAALRRDHPTVPLIVLSAVEDPAEVRAVLRSGAAGFIPKAAAAKVMLQAIRLVLAGGAYLPPQLMHLLDAGTEAAATTASDVAHDDGVACLSPRQREVFALLARGLSNKMIARQLGITEGTVKSHVATIFDLLKVHNRVSAVAEARRLADGLDARRRADA